MKIPQYLSLLGTLFASTSLVEAFFAVTEPTFSILVEAEEAQASLNRQNRCCPTAYIRAPDLRPGMTPTVDARLLLNGTGCDKFEKWEVGLRLKEWAIFRFSAPNVTLPVRPEWSPEFDTPPKAEDSLDEDDDMSGLFDNVFVDHWGNGRQRQTAFQKAMQDYDKAMTNKSLWHFQGVEREVFDSRIELDLQHDEQTIKNETTHIAVRQFTVEVPDTNFPPQVDGYNPFQYSSSEFEDSSRTQTMFEYYFLLTLKDGTTIDVPAGKTAFIPANTEGPMSPLAEQVKRAPEGERVLPIKLSEVDMSSGPRFTGRLNDIQEQNDQTSNFTVELTLPMNPTFEAGRNVTVQAKIIKTGNSTDVPHGISLSLGTCTIDVWARSHATNANHTQITDRCTYPQESHWWAQGSSSGKPYGDLFRQRRDMKDLCIHPVEIMERDETSGGMSGGPAVTSSYIYPWGEGDEGMTLFKGAEAEQTIDVNLTIPLHMVPTFETTFQHFKHLLTVVLTTSSETEQASEDAEGSDQEVMREVGDLETGDNWVPYPDNDALWARQPRRMNNQKRPLIRHKGTAEVKLLAPSEGEQPAAINTGMTESRIRHYTDPRALAIRLIGKGHKADGTVPYVNTAWRTDFKLSELSFDRYDVFNRRDRFCEGSPMRYARGSGSDLVSDIWARKACPEYRKNWFAANKKGKKEVERNEPGGIVDHVDSLMHMGTQQMRLD